MKKVRAISTIALALMFAVAVAAQNKHVPTIDELLTLKTIGAAQISPNGKWIAYTVGYGDFKTDAFVNPNLAGGCRDWPSVSSYTRRENHLTRHAGHLIAPG
jgi:hypothetical protein